MGVEHHTTTPEDAQANGFAEAFVKILVKLVHKALVEKRDPRKMVSRYLMTYRATPHKVTGRSPAELLFNRKIRTKLPGLRVQQGETWTVRSGRGTSWRNKSRKLMQMRKEKQGPRQ